jgi:endoglucanase
MFAALISLTLSACGESNGPGTTASNTPGSPSNPVPSGEGSEAPSAGSPNTSGSGGSSQVQPSVTSSGVAHNSASVGSVLPPDTSSPPASSTNTPPPAVSVPQESEVTQPSQAVSPFIVVDQFGYLPDSEKIAVLRDPDTGFDAADAYTWGTNYQVIDATSGAVALEVAPVQWNGGAVDEDSGDRAAWVDFSQLTAPGVYFVLDVDADVRSDLFRVAPDVYNGVLRHAFRTFFYQRAGFAKTAAFAGDAWADGASHLGPGQDANARLYGATDDASTERDLSGGWYDAGDYNRYTPWTAEYIVTLLRMYEEAPSAFGDDFGIPESANGISDVLDEARFGLTHLVKTQSESGGCISVLGVGSASPPSAATDPSVYGPETTNATIRAGIAFAWAARVFADLDASLAADLFERAERAWDFAEANPDLVFTNSGKVAAGEQQSSPEEVKLFQAGLAVALYRAGGDAKYKVFFETNYDQLGLQMLSGYNAAWQLQLTEFYLDYTLMSDADPTVKDTILSAFNSTLESADNLGMLSEKQDPYLAYIADYTWGSNAHKSRTGVLFYDVISFATDAAAAQDARVAAERYIHYLHGVNPLGLVYLSNMGPSGAYKSASSFFHTWFADGSERWDEVGVSTYGPAPGFLTGGPNPSYDWDGVCPGNELCPAERPTPPYGQPAAKSYADFNTSWPTNSWAVTENSNGYQVYYLRLLSKFVNPRP